MKVSVLLPTLYPNLAQRAIASLRKTGRSDVDLEIVVCSPTKFEGEGIVWVEDADPSGNCAAIRKALEAATGDYILSFSDDAVVAEGWLVGAAKDFPLWESLGDGAIVHLNHGAVGTCFGRLYANFPLASRQTVDKFKADYYPTVAHWGDVAFGMAAWKAMEGRQNNGESFAPAVLVTKERLTAFQSDRMGNPESKHRTTAFMQDTAWFMRRFMKLGAGWPMENFRQYNIDLPADKVDASRTIWSPSRSDFMTKYLEGNMPAGDWLEGGLWLMPTHRKPAECQKTLDAIARVGSVTKGIVWVNGGEQPTGYSELVLPAGWKIEWCPEDVPVCEMYRRFYKQRPSLNWYGVICDDVVPETGGWDVELVMQAGDRHISSANDGWQNGQEGRPRRMHGAQVFGGELVRKLGYLCIDGLKHNCFDDQWETVGKELGIWRYLMNVMTRHEHPWKTGDRSMPAYEKTLDSIAEDRAVFNAWNSKQKHDDFGRVRELHPHVKQTPVKIAGKKVLFATPCHDGKLTTEYVHSLIASCMTLAMNGASFDIAFIPGESLIMRARNALVKIFMDRGCDYLLFVDADMGWDAMAVVRLLSYEQDVVAVAGVRKSDEPTFCCNLEGPQLRFSEQGLLAVHEVGTGFMLISRACIEKMIKAYGHDLTYTDVGTGTKYVGLFNTRIADGYMWSEDYVFCQRWRNLGGTVWLDPHIGLTHRGSKNFGGVLMEQLMAAVAAAQQQPQQQAGAAE